MQFTAQIGAGIIGSIPIGAIISSIPPDPPDPEIRYIAVTSLFATANISGTATAVQLSSLFTTVATARWISLNAPSANTAGITVGDSTVTASRGMPVAKGSVPYVLPPIPIDERQGIEDCLYDLSKIYVFVGSGDAAQVLIAR